MQKRSVLNSPRLLELKRKRRKALLFKILLWITFFIAIISSLILIFRIPKLNISEIKISGNNVIENEEIKEIVNNKLSGKYFWIFPRTNFIFFPKKEIKNDLSIKFKRLKDISIETNTQNPQILEIVLTEREGKYTWCGNTQTKQEEKEKCYFLDESGYIFDESPYFSREVYFKFYGLTDENKEDPLGSYFAKNIFNNLVLFKEEVEKNKIKPAAFVLEDDNGAYMTISPKNNQQENPKIIVTKNLDLVKAAKNLKKVLTTEPLKTDFIKKYSSLLYIDLRFGNKVYYKFEQ